METSELITAALRPYPSRLIVEVTTRCNLNCFMCVKQSDDSNIAEGDLSDEVFKALEPAMTNLEALILNGVGESLLHPKLETVSLSTLFTCFVNSVVVPAIRVQHRRKHRDPLFRESVWELPSTASAIWF